MTSRLPRHPLSGQDLDAWAKAMRTSPWGKPNRQRILASLEVWGGYSSARPTAETLEDFTVYSSAKHAPSSVTTSIQLLMYGLAVVDPDVDWTWIGRWLRSRRPARTAQPSPPVRASRRSTTLVPEQWPDGWADRWLSGDQGKRPRRFGRRGGRSGWSVPYRQRIERGLGRFARFLADHSLPPEISEATVAAYEAHELGLGTAAQSLGMYLWELHVGGTIVEPGLKHQWLLDLVDKYKGAPPTRCKAAKMVARADLDKAAQHLMQAADVLPLSVRAALRFRDGLLIGLLSNRALRRRNVAELTIGESLIVSANDACILLQRTKNKCAYIAPWPRWLLAALGRWIERYRPVLETCDSGDALWLTRYGRPMRPDDITRQVTTVTRRTLGRAVNPHLFRDILATSIVETDPSGAPIASAMLTHRDRRTTDRWYQHAGSYSAAGDLENVVAEYQTPPRFRRRF